MIPVAISLFSSILFLILALSYSRRKGAGKIQKIVPWIIVATWIVSAVLTSLSFSWAFDALETVSLDQRARALGEGISSSLNYAIIAGAITLILFIASVFATFSGKGKRVSEG